MCDPGCEAEGVENAARGPPGTPAGSANVVWVYSLTAMRLFSLALLFVACSGGLPPVLLLGVAEPIPAPTMTLFDFDSPDGSDWTVENDQVMGGHSVGSVEVSDGVLRFTGTLVTRDGGFSQTRAPKRADLRGYSAVELRVRGDGRTYQVDMDDGSERGGRDVARRGSFATTEDWRTVRVPFSSLEATVHGEPANAEPLDLGGVESIALYIADGKDGPFRLEVDWIRAVE